MSADDALAVENGDGGGRPGPEPEARNAAAGWLKTLLAVGVVEAAKVKDEALAAGLAWRTVQRAAEALNVIREKNAFNGGWQWRLPKPGNEDATEHAKSPEREEPDILASSVDPGETGHFSMTPNEGARLPDFGMFADKLATETRIANEM